MDLFTFATNMQRMLMIIRKHTGTDFPSQQLAVLMDVAAHPKTPIGGISERLDISQSSVSRAVAALTKWSWTKKEGYGLVEKVEDLYESRRKLVRLTQHGKQLVDQMQKAFEETSNVETRNETIGGSS